MGRNSKQARSIQSFGLAFSSGLVFAMVLASVNPLASLADSKGNFPGKGSKDAWTQANSSYSEGAALAKAGKHALAVAKFKKAIEVYGDDSAYYFNMGKSFKKMNDLAQAEGAFKKATELEPGDVYSWFLLGSTEWAQGKLKESQDAFQQAAKLNPTGKLKTDIAWYLSDIKTKIQ